MEELFSGYGLRVTLEETALPNGGTKKTSRVHISDTVQILALPTDRTVLLLHEYRPIWKTKIWTIPSGKIDKENNPAVAAQRELREETGFRAQEIEPYFQCNHWDKVNYTCYVFTARHLVKDPLPQDENESIEVHEFPFSEAIQRVLKSPFIHTLSAAALLRYAREQGI